MRKITYVRAINEALSQLLEKYNNMFLIGQGVNSPWYVGNTTRGLVDRFGPERVIDTPVSESGISGAAVGAALAGMRPVLVFPRMDFMYYAMDQIANHAAPWHYMFGGQLSVPIVIWAIINRGGEQAAQHSQALQALFVHLPGLKVVMPGTPYDAKGLLAASVQDDNPVIYIDDRRLYEIEGEVPEELYNVPIGEAAVRREGKDVTLTVTSYLLHEAMKAAAILSGEGIDAEVIDLRSLKPLDENTLLKSVKKTGRLVTVDGDWRTGGTGAELAAVVAEKAIPYLKSPVIRVALPDAPAPASRTLEKAYYPDMMSIAAAARKSMGAG
jgi:acetoin:2,6-dichlorophenolindophenol oxidoreductase subunit beta